jgi:hypothetical protein
MGTWAGWAGWAGTAREARYRSEGEVSGTNQLDSELDALLPGGKASVTDEAYAITAESQSKAKAR